jgi:hypothetical protein
VAFKLASVVLVPRDWDSIMMALVCLRPASVSMVLVGLRLLPVDAGGVLLASAESPSVCASCRQVVEPITWLNNLANNSGY